MIRPRAILTGCLAVLLVLCAICPAQAEALLPMAEVRAATPAHWAETYQTPWQSVVIDVPVEVPPVDAFPVVRVRLMPAVASALLADYQDVASNVPGHLTANRLIGDTLAPGTRPRTQLIYEGGIAPERPPEGVSLSYEEALALCYGEIHRLWGLSDTDVAVQRLIVEDRAYHYRRAGDEIVWGAPASDAGRYKFYFRQLIHGISVEGGMGCYQSLGPSAEAALRTATCYLAFSEAANIKIRAALYEEIDVVQADVPLFPFAAAKQALEAEIRAGRLRSVDVMKLCYIPYLDAQEDGMVWLLPAWYAKGQYATRDADDAPVEEREVIFQALEGTLLDASDTRPDRRVVPGGMGD